MKAHDPNDDPFAALSAEYDAAHTMKLPSEFGSGIVKNESSSPEVSVKKAAAEEDHTEATVEEDESSRHEDEPAKEEEEHHDDDKQ